MGYQQKTKLLLCLATISLLFIIGNSGSIKINEVVAVKVWSKPANGKVHPQSSTNTAPAPAASPKAETEEKEGDSDADGSLELVPESQ